MMVGHKSELLKQGNLAEEEVSLERQAWMLERFEDEMWDQVTHEENTGYDYEAWHRELTEQEKALAEMWYEDPETAEEAKRRVRESV